MQLTDTVTIKSFRYSPEGIEPVSLEVSAEYSITIFLNDKPYLSMACSGTDLAYLAIGRLISEGLLVSREEIVRIDVNENLSSVNVITAGDENIADKLFETQKCRTDPITLKNNKASQQKKHTASSISPSIILSAMNKFLNKSEGKERTHGAHSAALFNLHGKNLASFDEIGRHNAVDKLLGKAMLHGLNAEMAMLLSTGRISGEIVLKASAMRIPVIATRSATTSRAVDLAKTADIVLITGVKKDSFYIHHGVERIIDTQDPSGNKFIV